MRTADFDYLLPAGAIAQHARPRGTSRLLVLDRNSRESVSERIDGLPARLRPDDVLVINDARVIPARLRATRPGGGETELLLIRPLGDDAWEVMARPAKRLRSGTPLTLGSGIAVPLERLDEGRWSIRFDPPLSRQVLDSVGEVPLPPYIERDGGPTVGDRQRYQTVYAREGRAVAAPTAGLHFTPELLAAIRDRGVDILPLTLHVGPGTFRPVQVDDPREHRLDMEDYEISPTTAAHLNRAVAAGRRIVAVGTTSCRSLEHAFARGAGHFHPGWDRADLFIMPGYRFLAVQGLLTNFHLPKSTLLMLVAALVGRERVLAAYETAHQQGFRFYSFGDAMLVL